MSCGGLGTSRVWVCFLVFLRLCWFCWRVFVFGQDALGVFVEAAVCFWVAGDGWNFSFRGILDLDRDKAFRGDQDQIDFFFWACRERREVLDGLDFHVFVAGEELISNLDFLAEQFEGAGHAGGETVYPDFRS